MSELERELQQHIDRAAGEGRYLVAHQLATIRAAWNARSDAEREAENRANLVALHYALRC